MRAIDTVFIIFIFSSYLKDSKQKYFMLILPLLAFIVGLFNANLPESIASFVLPVMAVLACVISVKLAPMSLLLLFAEYNHFWEVLMIPFLWYVVTVLMETLNDRIEEEYIPSYVRGFPIQIISLGILYHIFQPLLLI